MRIFNDISEYVGNTPLFSINRFKSLYDIDANLFAKVEFFNPAGSAKDRAALGMILDAEEKGLLKENSVIIEPTSGNTGIALAALCAVRGYKVILTMPESMSVERRKLLSAYGAQLVLTDASKGMNGAVEKAKELAQIYENSIIAGQFENSANPMAHYNTTGPEIYNDTDGKVDIFVAGIGTGGTVSGIGKYLKEQNHDIKIIGVEPFDSPLITEGKSGPHKIQGIGANFVPQNLDMSVIDEVIAVKSDDAFEATRNLAKSEGLLVGISSGAALHAAVRIAKRIENTNKNIVVLLPDTGDRYLSAELF